MARVELLGTESHRVPHLATDRVDEMLGGGLHEMLDAAAREVRTEWQWTGALLDPEDVARMETVGGEISTFVRQAMQGAEKREQATQAAVMTLWLRAFLNHRLIGGDAVAVAPSAAERLLATPLEVRRDRLAAPAACLHVLTVDPGTLEAARDYVAVRGFDETPAVVEAYVMRLDTPRDAQGVARDAGGTIDVHVFFGCKGFGAPIYAARQLVVGEGTVEEALCASTREGTQQPGDAELRRILRLVLGAWLISSEAALRPLESSVADRFAPRGFGKGKFEKFLKARRTVTRVPVRVLEA